MKRYVAKEYDVTTRDVEKYYLNTALQAMEQALSCNKDTSVASHLSRAIDALHKLMNQSLGSDADRSRQVTDPHEVNEFNSAI